MPKVREAVSMRKIDKNPHKKVASIKTDQQSTMMEQEEANREAS